MAAAELCAALHIKERQLKLALFSVVRQRQRQ
jgi:hypothetical protein